ncbi:hypothetical protein MSG28_003793 [Choristoneura fumiferana]|uniref:Uncharacterized protein n=1 Tax=Choristoneura fumiferana TaxID=7141 RepID=A0ACC0KHF4_CHOFU|nr:hypothetical protein MSG28_003793 [Choristoneura fumiferana]
MSLRQQSQRRNNPRKYLPHNLVNHAISSYNFRRFTTRRNDIGKWVVDAAMAYNIRFNGHFFALTAISMTTAISAHMCKVPTSRRRKVEAVLLAASPSTSLGMRRNVRVHVDHVVLQQQRAYGHAAGAHHQYGH